MAGAFHLSVLCVCVLLCLASATSKAKHNIAILSLVAVTGWFIFTLLSEISIHQWVEIENLDKANLPAILGIPLHVPHGVNYAGRYNYIIEGILPYITFIYGRVDLQHQQGWYGPAKRSTASGKP